MMHFSRELAVFAVLAGAATVAMPAAKAPATTSALPPATAGKPHRYQGGVGQADRYYATMWGVDQLRLKKTSSGELIRFTYRVIDVSRAKIIHDKKAEPHLIDQHTHVMLSVPTLENVGALRQTEAIAKDKDYWVLFSNKGDKVKIGDRVDVVIGDFYVSGLQVE
jgi:phosphoribosyl 1,2-cyclic phosphodiesterase